MIFNQKNIWEASLQIPVADDTGQAHLTKRQRQFEAGRRCAEQAFLQAGEIVSGADIPRGENGAPLWPKNWTGSIAHTDTEAICVIARQTHFLSLGVDVEYWIGEQVSQEISNLVLCTADRVFLNSTLGLQTKLTFEQSVTLLFSAKEALYKALFPLVQEYFDFQDAEVVQWNPTILTLQLNKTIGQQSSHPIQAKKNFSIFWKSDSQRVHCLCRIETLSE